LCTAGGGCRQPGHHGLSRQSRQRHRQIIAPFSLIADDEAAGRIIRHGDVTTYYAADGSVIATERNGVLTVYSPDGDVLCRVIIPRPTDPKSFYLLLHC
jgi:hypothetical protein